MIVLLVTKLLYIHFEMSRFDFATLINYRYKNHDGQHLNIYEHKNPNSYSLNL